MSNKKKDNEVFLSFLGDTKPIKKSNKNFKKLKNIVPVQAKIKKINKKTTLKDPEIKTKTHHINILKVQKTKMNKKLKKGKIPINKKIDFHGLTLTQAKKIFFQTVDECYYSNKRCLLFVTGKGVVKNNYETFTNKLYQGKIRNHFVEWTNENEVSNKVLNVEPAGPSHGGDGAFFVYLRKTKR
jgi:DNA-nicking Smr family endonuclease